MPKYSELIPYALRYLATSALIMQCSSLMDQVDALSTQIRSPGGLHVDKRLIDADPATTTQQIFTTVSTMLSSVASSSSSYITTTAAAITTAIINSTATPGTTPIQNITTAFHNVTVVPPTEGNDDKTLLIVVPILAVLGAIAAGYMGYKALSELVTRGNAYRINPGDGRGGGGVFVEGPVGNSVAPARGTDARGAPTTGGNGYTRREAWRINVGGLDQTYSETDLDTNTSPSPSPSPISFTPPNSLPEVRVTRGGGEKDHVNKAAQNANSRTSRVSGGEFVL